MLARDSKKAQKVKEKLLKQYQLKVCRLSVLVVCSKAEPGFH